MEELARAIGELLLKSAKDKLICKCNVKKDRLNGKRNAKKADQKVVGILKSSVSKERGKNSVEFYWNDRRKHKRIWTISFYKNERTEHFIFWTLLWALYRLYAMLRNLFMDYLIAVCLQTCPLKIKYKLFWSCTTVLNSTENGF